ncbi:Diaminopimelate epimerase, partial [hydrothermal vent metagenome]
MTIKMEKPPRIFRKMHGLGNDFVIFDGRADRLDLTGDQARHIADR